jgi:hypothetical protein
MAGLGNFDFLPADPIELISTVGNLVTGIIKMAHNISTKIEDVKVNKRQCLILSERINRMTEYLDSHEFKKQINSYGGTLEKTLQSFHTLLKECYEYISLLADTGWIKNFIYSREYKEKFTYFNEQLGLLLNELSLGINIKNFINKPKPSLKSPYLMKNGSAGFGKRDNGFISPVELADNSIVSSSNNIFVNGIWSQRYSKDGVWHGPFKQKITFNSNTNTFKGQGENDVGQFTVSGTFSKHTNQIDINQLYKYGTGNPQLNIGHQCRFQLTWNKGKRVFEGIHYIPTGWGMMPAGKVEMAFVSAA